MATSVASCATAPCRRNAWPWPPSRTGPGRLSGGRHRLRSSLPRPTPRISAARLSARPGSGLTAPPGPCATAPGRSTAPLRDLHSRSSIARLTRRQTAGPGLVQPVGGLIPDPGHEPGQRRHPRQQHRVERSHSTPSREDGLRAVAGVPRPGVAPTARTPSSASANSFSPQAARSHRDARTGCVRRSVYRLTHDGSAIPSCPARWSSTTAARPADPAGTSPGTEPSPVAAQAQPLVITAPLATSLQVSVIEEEHLLQLGLRRRAA